MQKNEGHLLAAWLRYHVEIVGPLDIVIIDNGSTDPLTLEVLRDGERQGVRVDRRFRTKADFETKHKIMFNAIQEAQRSGGADFIFPLDADEFLAVVGDDGEVRVDRDSIDKELAKCTEASCFKMKGSYYNNATKPGTYFFYREHAVFFGRDPIKSIDLGYHQGSTESNNPPVDTNIVVVHFQYKRLEVAKVFAVEKLKNRVSDFGTETLRAFTGMGSHMTKYFLYTSEDYAQLFGNAKIELPRFEQAITADGNLFPYDMFFATDRYAAQRPVVEKSPALGLLRREGLSVNEVLLIGKYAGQKNQVAVFRESALSSFLFEAGVWQIAMVGTSDDRLEEVVATFSLQRFMTMNRLRVFHIPIGATDELGYPTDDPGHLLSDRYAVESVKMLSKHTQVVIVNGRYRIAVALQCLKRMGAECVFIFPSFWSRPHYHAILPFFDMIDTEHDTAVLRRTSQPDMDRLEKLLETARLDAR